MKIFICLLSILQSVMGGGAPLWISEPGANDHAFSAGQQVVKVILIDGGKSPYNGFSDFSHRNSYGRDHSYSDAYSKVHKIQEFGQQSGSRHFYGNSHPHANSNLNALLPEILKIILESSASGDNDNGVNAQVISAYDHKGAASVTRTKGQPSYDLKGGYVIQTGTLEVTRTIHNADFGGKLGGGISW